MTSLSTPAPSAAVQVLWAKSGQKSAQQQGAAPGWLPVLHHLLDVGACAQAILEREPARTRERLAGDFGTDAATALKWTCVLAALHDLGKASPAFQHKAPELAARVWALLPEQNHDDATPHGLVTQRLLPGLLRERGWSVSLANGVAQAIGCHHGYRGATPRAADRGTGSQWEAVHRELLDLVLRGFGLEEAAPPEVEWTGEAFMRLAGLTSFADWIGSSFALAPEPDPKAFSDPAAYVSSALERACTALDGIGWTQRRPLVSVVGSVDDTFSFIPGFQARPLQTLLAELLTTPDERPALILIEAPMGEGKTEAALYSHLQLQQQAEHRGLYLALPTQATGNAMYTRLRRFLDVQIGARSEPLTVDLQLLHGGAALHGAYQADLAATAQQVAQMQTMQTQTTQTRARPEREQHPHIQPNTAAEGVSSVQAGEWFSHRKRALLGEYGVGTVDQALLGVLNISHQFVRLWGLGNRVVVLDEVHAYDTYTTQLIHALCRWLRALDSSVIIMSATLPAQTRRDLLDAWNVTPDQAPSYPRLTVARTGDAAPVSRHIPGPRRRLSLNLQATDPAPLAMAQQAVHLVEEGGTVTVIVNTVQRAQQVFTAVRELLGDRFQSIHKGCKHAQAVGVHLYHARYPAQDRSQREERVLRYLGTQPARFEKGGQPQVADVRPSRFILIATQVAEQSLDFDTDVMISDLAPVDLLLQRAGRLHRHTANTGRRGGHEQPVLYVAGLGDWPEAALSEYQWKYIYAPALLYRSWHVLQGRSKVTLPDDLDELVQTVYNSATPPLTMLNEAQQTTLKTADQVLAHQRRNHATTGSMAHIGSPATFLNADSQVPQGDPDGEPVNDDADSSLDTAAQYGTRLGEPSLRIVPVHHIGGSVWLDESGQHPAQTATLGKGNWDAARSIFARSLQVSRYDIIEKIDGQLSQRGLSCGSEWRGWNAHPLLRDAKPLVLVNGEAVLGRTRVRLDPELGLVYERVKSPGGNGRELC